MRLLLLSVLTLLCLQVNGQSSYVPKRTITYDLVDRYRVLYDVETPIVSSTSNYFRSDISPFAAQLYKLKGLSDLSKSDLSYLIEDNLEYLEDDASPQNIKTFVDTNETFYMIDEAQKSDSYIVEKRDPIFKYFYKNKATFLEFNNENILIKANPILNIGGSLSQDENTNVFQNTRGLEIRGLIDNKVYFYTNLLENQRAFLNFQQRRIDAEKAIPGSGLYKGYGSKVAEQLVGLDYFNAQGYFGLPVSKNISIEFGHGNHFWGDGERSLLLSDNAHNYLYFKINSRVWKFQLQNVFAELASISSQRIAGDQLIPKKFFAAHYLTFAPTKKFSISLFESVIFSREQNFELQYLNPIILYRSVEHFIGSPDNVLVGLNGRWDLFNRISLYGQLILDEFKLGELTAGNGWWGNKYGLQLGLKYFNAFNIDHLDLQLEHNVVRPFTYSHRTPLEDFPDRALTSYTHFSQALAHPLGANFRETLLKFRYQVSSKWLLAGRAYLSTYGADTSSEVFGGNVHTLNSLRSRQEGFNIGDGNTQDILGINITASYMFAHNYWVDFTGLYRSQESLLTEGVDTKVFSMGIRANMVNQPFDY